MTPAKEAAPFSFRVYRLLVQCYPTEFRKEWEREMLQTFRDCYREAVRQQVSQGLLRLWSLTLYDLTLSVSVEHWRAFLARWRRLFGFEERKIQVMTSLFSICVGERSDIGRVRSENEDSFLSYMPQDSDLLSKKGALFVVADGLGGHTGGEQASQLAVSAVREAYYADDGRDTATALKQAIEYANERIYQENKAKSPAASKEKMMGTTCVAAVVLGDTLYAANVGDSRVYVVRNGQVRQITKDHSLVADQVTAGLLTDEQARAHPERNKIYHCLGLEKVEVDAFTEKVQEGELILLCTDGLWQLLSDEEIGDIVEQYSPEESVQRLIEQANERGGVDNTTVVVASIGA